MKPFVRSLIQSTFCGVFCARHWGRHQGYRDEQAQPDVTPALEAHNLVEEKRKWTLITQCDRYTPWSEEHRVVGTKSRDFDPAYRTKEASRRKI